MGLEFAGKVFLAVVGALLTVDLALIAARGLEVDWVGYVGLACIGFGLLATGQFYRAVGRAPNIALALTGAGFYILFTIVASAFNYLLLPVGIVRFDAALAAMDRSVGFNWPEFVAWFVNRPILVGTLRVIYLSSLLQLIVVTTALGFCNLSKTLEEFLLVGMLGALLTMAIWYFAPSFGAFSTYHLDPSIAADVPTVLDASYAAQLSQLAVNGPHSLSPNNTLGLIGFPSFHTVMALMSVWYARPSRALFPLAIIINILMLPAVLLHGGHHLMDVLGGVAVFLLSVWLSRKILALEPKCGAEQLQPAVNAT